LNRSKKSRPEGTYVASGRTALGRANAVMERRAIMTVQEVARYLRVHTMTVYRLIQRGDLPAVRVGRSWRFRTDEISRWLLDRAVNCHDRDDRQPRPGTGHVRDAHGRRKT
jgi:excisionase family DNA binding protein